VPASQLSFFPPSSSSSALKPSPSVSRGSIKRSGIPSDFLTSYLASQSPSSSPPSQSHMSALLSSPSQPSIEAHSVRSQLSTIFNALPIAPSTRDTLMARLSLDSGASTPTQASEEQEHELETMGDGLKSSQSLDSIMTRGRISALPTVPPIKEVDFGSLHRTVRGANVELTSIAPISPPSMSRQGSATSTRRHRGLDYVSPERPSVRPEVIRTAQLQPSPVMQLPLKPKVNKG